MCADFSAARERALAARLEASAAKNNCSPAYAALLNYTRLLNARRLHLSAHYSAAVEKLLRGGVHVINSLREGCNGVYYFAGHSKSQLRNSACYLVRAEKAEIRSALYGIGDFGAVKDLAKLVKAMGLLFTTVKAPMRLPGTSWAVEEDVESADGRHCFTDGCGRMPTDAARALMAELGLPLAARTVSAMQVRFRGFKGMLVHDPTAEKIFFTPSMRKFEDCGDCAVIGVCNWSRPFQTGYLITQYGFLFV